MPQSATFIAVVVVIIIIIIIIITVICCLRTFPLLLLCPYINCRELKSV